MAISPLIHLQPSTDSSTKVYTVTVMAPKDEQDSSSDTDSEASFHSIVNDFPSNSHLPTTNPLDSRPQITTPDAVPDAAPPDFDEKDSSPFPPDEEAALLDESNTLKMTANAAFQRAEYAAASSGYRDALEVCPTYLCFEIAVLRSNLAACELVLTQYQAAIEEAGAALSLLRGRLDGEKPQPRSSNTGMKSQEPASSSKGRERWASSLHTAGEKQAEESDDEDLPTTAELCRVSRMQERGHASADITRLSAKCLLRRARAYSSLGGWSALEKSRRDYQALLKPPYTSPPSATSHSDADSTNPGTKSFSLPAEDAAFARRQVRELEEGIKAAQEKETAEMLGKLKELGNGLLKPFGLSTDSFQMVKNESGDGYSLSMKS